LAKQGVEVKRVTSSTTYYYVGDDFPRKDIDLLNRETPGWRTEPKGIPTRYYLREDGGTTLLGLVPAPSVAAGETWTLTVPYVANVPDMSADADQPFTASSNAKITLRPWHQGLVHYAAAKLELLRKNTDGEASQMQKFGGYVADYLQRQRPKGGRHVSFARKYYRERPGGSFAPWQTQDPRRWP